MPKRRVNAIDALKAAIEREKGANSFYDKAADMTQDAKGKSTFQWLAKEELKHLAKLREQLKSVLDNNSWLEWKTGAVPIDRTEFPPVSEATGEIDIDVGELDALRQAIESERKAIGYYKWAEDSTPDLHGKDMFKALTREEEGHLALLEEELEWITKSHQHFTLHRFNLGSG